MTRVLLVDDELAEARTLRRAARASRDVAGIHVDDCRSARAALKRVGERNFDVVIVDRGLADMDGLQLGRLLRAAGYTRALVMLTGRFTRPEDERAAFAMGFDDYVRKPADAPAFLARIVAVAHRAGLRTGERRSPAGAEPQWFALADEALEVSSDAPMAFVFSRPVSLTPLKWRILRALYARRGQIVAWSILIQEAWGADPPTDPQGSAAKQVRQLSRVLAAGELVDTVRGHGARLRFWNRNYPE